jgi:hypothetical protein
MQPIRKISTAAPFYDLTKRRKVLRAQSTQLQNYVQLHGKVQFGEKIRRGGGIEKKYSWILRTGGEAWYSLHLKG